MIMSTPPPEQCIGGHQKEMLFIEKFGRYKTEVKERKEKERLALRN